MARRKKNLFSVLIGVLLLVVLVVGVSAYLATPQEEETKDFPIEQPVISIDGNTLNISIEDHGYIGFYVYVCDIYKANVTETTVDLLSLFEDYDRGEYTVKVRAYGEGDALSKYSNAVTYAHAVDSGTGDTETGDSGTGDTETGDGEDSGALGAPTIALNGDILTITSGDTRTDSYSLKVDAGLGVSYPADTETVDLAELLKSYNVGSYTITVTAWYGAETSEASNSVVYVKETDAIAAPKIHMNNNILVVKPMGGDAETVKVFVDGEYVTEDLYDECNGWFHMNQILEGEPAGEYKLTAQLIYSDGTVSELSNEVSYWIPTPDEVLAPTAYISDDTLHMTANAENADFFEVFVDGESIFTTRITYPRIALDTSLAKYAAGDHKIKVRTWCSEKDIYSVFAPELTYTIAPIATNTLTLNAQGSCYYEGASYDHTIDVYGAGASQTYTVTTTVVGDEYDSDRGEYATFTYPVVHVADITGLSDDATITIECENVRTDGSPVSVIAEGCDAESTMDFRVYTDDDGEEYSEDVNVVTVTNITDGASVTIVFDADA